MDKQIAKHIIIEKKQVGKHIEMLCACNVCEKKQWYRECYIKPTKDHSHGTKGKFCSKTCYGIWQKGKRNPYHWQGGIRFQNKKDTKHPYIMEHVGFGNYYTGLARKVMSEHLKRPLKRNELVAHLNGDRTDNRIENLYIKGQLIAKCKLCNQEKLIHAVLLCKQCYYKQAKSTERAKNWRKQYYQKNKEKLLAYGKEYRNKKHHD